MYKRQTQAVAPLTGGDVHSVDDLMELGDLMALASLDAPELHDKPFTPVVPPALREGRNIFDAIRERDVLVHHPYESFSSSVEAFLEDIEFIPVVVDTGAVYLFELGGNVWLRSALMNPLVEAQDLDGLLAELRGLS